jgi:1,4-alpha-glucan branching enzyme
MPRTAIQPASASLLTQHDLHLFNEGTHYRLYEKLGAHPLTVNGVTGMYFAVWAPGAERVSVLGDFNGWRPDLHVLRPRESSGIWEGFVPGVGPGACYKYHIASRYHGYRVEKADPFAFRSEVPPKTGSIVWDLDYIWADHDWMATRRQRNALSAPISIYEVHLGSWLRPGGMLSRPSESRNEEDTQEGPRKHGTRSTDSSQWLTYREVAPRLAEYVLGLGFTHVEFLPLMEHPFYGSWGYQTTGYFAPTARYGTPQDLMFLIDHLHQRGIGVILDWVPSHFPSDQHGLAYFDGTHLYEHANPQQGYHPDWKSSIFNYGRHEVVSFLMSSGMFWLDRYHADGLRVDAVASMLYLDYSRRDGEWVPNIYGGRENLDAIGFLRRFNEEVYRNYPDVQTIAEESTAWPMVSRPVYVGGLGFGLKWDMGWMNDTLRYLSRDPIHRSFHHNELLFRLWYAFSENYVLPLSHDEVVHGKGSLVAKMPGDDWQKFANLRLLFGYTIAQPGKKLIFMGDELGTWREWDHDSAIDWSLVQHPNHAGVQQWLADLNHLYRTEPALHEYDCDPRGFEWIDCNDAEGGVIAFVRKAHDPADAVLIVCNFTPVVRHAYRVGVPNGGSWKELLNSDASIYWGSGQGNLGAVIAEPTDHHGRPFSLSLTVPPLAVLFFKAAATITPQATDDGDQVSTQAPQPAGN